MEVVGPTGPPLVGRADLRARLDARLDALAGGGGGGLLWVSGDAGIGKSRLLDELGHLAAMDGIRTVRAVGWADADHPAFWLWTQVLRGLTGSEPTSSGLLGRWGRRARPVLRILPELAPEPDAADSQRGAEPFPLFDAMAAVLESEVDSGPLVLLLDDLHWADPGSLRLLHYLVATALPPRVLVACGWRDHEADRATDELRAELVRSAEPMPLQGLDVPDVAELVARSSGLWIDVEEAVELTSRTGGNPLFVTQVGRLAKVSGTSSMARLVPDSAQDLLRRRLTRVSQPTRDLLSVAAVAGAATDLSVLAEVCDLGAPALLALLDEAQASGLARVDGNRLVFVHDLVRDALQAGVTAVRRREVHLAVAATLAPAAETDPSRCTEVAHHLDEALPLGDLDQAVEYGIRAADAAFAAQAYEEAERRYARVRELLPPGSSWLPAVLLASGECLTAQGDLDTARVQFEHVAVTARAAGDGDLLARAAIGYAAGLSGFEVRLHDQAQIDLLEEALAALPPGDSVLRADVMARLSVALSYATELPRRVALAEEAVAMTRRIGDARATAHALAAHCDAIAGPDDAERRADDAGEIIRLAARVRDRGVMLLGLRLRVVALLEQGDILGAEADMAAFARVADDLGQPGYSFYVPIWEGFRAHARGELAEMESCIAEVRRLGERAGSRNAAVLAFVMESWLSVERLTAHESTPRMLQALGIVPELAPDGGGWLALYPGQPAAVRRAFLPRLEQMLATLPPDAEWTSALCWSAMTLIEADEPDEAPYAAVVYRYLLPHAHRFAIDGIAVGSHGSTERFLGGLAEMMGDLDRADEHFAAALEANLRGGGPLVVAHTRAAWAALLDRRGAPGDAERAGELRAQAVADYRAMGLTARADHTAGHTEVHPVPPVPSTARWVREGDFWRISYVGREATVKHGKGMTDLAVLLSRPGQEVHVLDLLAPGVTTPAGDLGDVVDDQARAAYRHRLEELDRLADEAAADGDDLAVSRLSEERDRLVAALASAYGIGGRVRRAGNPAERARTTVTSRLRDAIDRVAAAHEELGRHLRVSVRTGTYCSYAPEHDVPWEL